MVPLYAFAVTFSTIGRVLAGDSGKTSFPEPLIFYNLTMDEFHAKRWDNRQHALHLGKRVAYGQESKNDAEQQAVVEEHVLTCQEIGGPTHRPTYGLCWVGQPNRYVITCRDTMQHVRRAPQKSKNCPRENQICVDKKVFNYVGNPVKMPWCLDVIPVDKEVTEVSDKEDQRSAPRMPKFDGKKTLPTEVWSPGTWDTFWQLAGELSGESGSSGESGATFYYAGSKESDPTFRAQSPESVSSWCCMGCPSGLLTVETVGFRSEAWGFTVPAWILG